MTTKPEVGTYSKTVGTQVHWIRTALGLSQGELADMATERGLSLHQTTVSKIESGARNVSVDDLWTLAGALGVSVVELLGEKALETKPPVSEAIAQRIDAMADVYPEFAFPENSTTREGRSAAAMRHAYRTAARIARGEGDV